MSILIAGGAGFIGSYVNKWLNKNGYRTVIIDNLSQSHQDAVKYGEFLKGDIGDPHFLDFVFSKYKIQAVMHFAAFIDVGESFKNPLKYYENNVVKTLTLLGAMIKHGISYFVFSSSAAIFGYPQILPIPEDHPSNPINPYGETKWIIEKALKDFDMAYGLKSCCFRYFNAAGGDPEGEILVYQKKPSNLIPLTLLSLKSNSVLTINGTDYDTPDGTCVRDYIHIADLATAHLKGLEKLIATQSSMQYNLGNGTGYSIKDVIKATEGITRKKVLTKEGPRRPGDPPILLSDSLKARKELDWTPHFSSLDTIIKHAWMTLAP